MVAYTDVNGEQVNVGGTMIDSAAVYRGYKLAQEDGAERLVIYSCLPSFWNRSGTFNLELRLPGGGKESIYRRCLGRRKALRHIGDIKGTGKF